MKRFFGIGGPVAHIDKKELACIDPSQKRPIRYFSSGS
jgi:hypothetical protein